MKFAAVKSAVFSLSLLLGASICSAATVTIGPSGQYASPCAAFSHLSDGDTVQIDANGGTPYFDTGDCYIRANNLTISGVNGRPILDASNAGIAKGIWVEDGHDVVIDNFEFRNAKYNGSSGNAAGVRIEDGNPGGGNVTLQRCYIHDNGDGVLGGNVDATDQWFSANPYITFQYDEFANNGDGSGSTHNMYMGYGGNMNFTLQYSWSHDSYVGHTVKTRAPLNNLLYNLVDDTQGSTSYILDFPLGGSTYIVGNILYKGLTTNPNSNSAVMIWRDVYDNGAGDPEYGIPNEDLHFINNTMIQDPGNTFPGQFVNSSCFNASSDTCDAPSNGPVLTVPAVVENNIFLGPSTTTLASNQPSAVVHNNILLENTPANLAALFVDAAHFDFHLASSSPAIGAGVYPPTDNTGTADPKALAAYEYVHPSNTVARPTPTGATMDDGAYSYPRVDTPPALSVSATTPVQVPNTGTITVTGLPTPAAGQYNYVSFSSENLSAIPYIPTVATSTGTATATFQTQAVANDTVVTVDVYANGAHGTTNITVKAGAPVLSSLTIDGPYYPQSTVHLLGGSTTPIVIDLSSSDPSILYVPATVTIPAGQLSAETGSINGSLWGQTPSSKSATLTASYGGVTKTLLINVAAPFIHNFYCNVFPDCTVTGGQQLPFQLVMAGDYPPSGGPVTFTSDNPAVIPNQTLNIPGGNYNDNLNINTNAVSANTTVNVTIDVNGSTSSGSVVVTPSAGGSVAVVSGSGQTAAVGTSFANPLTVVVKDSSNNPVSGTTVTFAGSGVSFPGGAIATTNASGLASVTAQPTGTGALMVTATAAGVGSPATFSETGTAGAAASVAAVSGSGQTVAVGSTFANPLVVMVKDSGGNAVQGATVTFAGSGVSFPSGATAVTNASGLAQVTAKATTAGAITITASVAGVATPASFSETATGSAASIAVVSGSGQSGAIGTPFSNPLVVVVKDAGGNGVSGATVTFAGGGISFPAGATAVTNASGTAQVTAQATTTGAHTVTASVTGVSTPASFTETGTAAVKLNSITVVGSGPGTRVTLSGAATSPVVVQLSSSDSTVLSTPATVTVPTGSSSVVVGSLLGSLWTPANSARTATITATYGGVTKTVTGTFYSPSLHAFACSPSTCPAVIGGVAYKVTLQLAGTAPVGGGTVQITSSNPAVIPSQTVAIAAGQSLPATSPVLLTTNSVNTTATVNLTASFNGAAITVGPITVNPATGVKSVTSDGTTNPGTRVNLTAAAPAGGVVIQISSSDQTIASAPATVTVPAGQTYAEIGTLIGSLWTPAGTTKTATISATYNGVTKTLAKAYVSPGVSAFGCSISPCPSVVGGNSVNFGLTLSGTGAPAGGATVQITSDHPAVVPNQTVTVAAGQSIPSPTPFIVNTAAVTVNTVVHVSATYNGSTKAGSGGGITVTPAPPPASIAVVSGSGQSSVVGTPFTNPLVVVVKDASSNPVKNATVTFAGSNVSFPSGATATTDVNGNAQVTAQPTSAGSLTITASVTGVSTPASFSETGNAATALSSITQDSPYQSGTTVHLTGAAPAGGTVVTLSTSDASIEYVPASITVPEGQTSAETGSLLGSLWGQTPTSKTAVVTGVAGGVTKTLTMNVPFTTVHAFNPNGSVQGGQLLGFYMETAFNPAPYGGAPYTVSSDNPAIIPTQSFTLAAGQSNDFGRNLVTNSVTTTTTVNVTLNYDGVMWSVPVTVTP